MSQSTSLRVGSSARILAYDDTNMPPSWPPALVFTFGESVTRVGCPTAYTCRPRSATAIRPVRWMAAPCPTMTL